MKKTLVLLILVLIACFSGQPISKESNAQVPNKPIPLKYQAALKLSVQELWVILKIKAKNDLWQAIIIADDGNHTYLGEISSQFKAKSIFNEFGLHGSEFAANSIWNQFSLYGSAFMQFSAFNDFTSSPPMIVKNNTIIGRLTTNESLADGINPNLLKALFENEF